MKGGGGGDPSLVYLRSPVKCSFGSSEMEKIDRDAAWCRPPGNCSAREIRFPVESPVLALPWRAFSNTHLQLNDCQMNVWDVRRWWATNEQRDIWPSNCFKDDDGSAVECVAVRNWLNGAIYLSSGATWKAGNKKMLRRKMKPKEKLQVMASSSGCNWSGLREPAL